MYSQLATAGCFGCGSANPIGFKLEFQPHADGGVQAQFQAGHVHQGWDEVMHGGLVCVLLDEAMVWAAASKGEKYYTGSMQVKYRRPVATGSRVLLRGWLQRDRGRVLEMKAQLLGEDQGVLAESTGLLIRGRG